MREKITIAKQPPLLLLPLLPLLSLLLMSSLLILEISSQQMTDAIRATIVKEHNNLRRAEFATNMKIMNYNTYLESMALEWASRCSFVHGHVKRANQPWPWIGQNLYVVSAPKVNFSRAILVWSLERSYYNITDATCASGRMCGHYTQMVWADSANIGCAGVICPRLNYTTFTNAGFIVCDYGPGGNYVGESPYIYGKPCSTCVKSCISGLCA